ncbi:MAG: leucine-rich repeat domain-containing protein [Promethearchaeia archaeon]
MLNKNIFDINENIQLRLENNKTIIYVNGERFNQCKFVLLMINPQEKEDLGELDSIDKVIEKLSPNFNDALVPTKLTIRPEDEFWAHCSNLQAWVENNYDTRLLHRNLSFPLLKKLADIGDPIARRVFKEEIAKRLETNYLPTIIYLLCNGYLKFFSLEEIIFVIERIKDKNIKYNKKKFLKIFFGDNLNSPLNIFDFSGKLFLLLYPPLELLKTILKYGNKYLEIGYEHLYNFLDDIGKNNPKIVEREIINILRTCNESELRTALKYHLLDFIDTGKEDIRRDIVKWIIKSKDIRETLIINGYTEKIKIDDFKNFLSEDFLVLKDIESKANRELKLLIDSDDFYNEYYNSFDRIGFELSGSHVIKLDLSDIQLKTFPESILNLKFLKILILDYNEISSLPESISELEFLEVLSLEYNNLTELPKSLSNLKFLNYINVKGNKLKQIPYSLKKRRDIMIKI